MSAQQQRKPVCSCSECVLESILVAAFCTSGFNKEWLVVGSCPDFNRDNNTVMFAGNFGPPHAGHYLVCQVALKVANELVIAIHNPEEEHRRRRGWDPKMGLKIFQEFFEPALKEYAPDSTILTRLSRMADPIIYNLRSFQKNIQSYEGKNVVVVFGEDYLSKKRMNQYAKEIETARIKGINNNVRLNVAIIPRSDFSATKFHECLKEKRDCEGFIPLPLRDTLLLDTIKSVIDDDDGPGLRQSSQDGGRPRRRRSRSPRSGRRRRSRRSSRHYRSKRKRNRS